MRVEAFLCDAANVREGLLNILSAGVTRLKRSSFPAPLGLQLAMVMTLMPVEAHTPHKLRVVIQGQDGGKVAELDGQFGVAEIPATFQPGEPIAIPMVLDLKLAPIPSPGTYSVEVLVDTQLAKSLPFLVSKEEVPSNP
jgi:hypothetical protein